MQLQVSIANSLDPDAPLWGDPTGGWRPPGEAWLGLLITAGVPVTIGDEGQGLLIVADDEAGGDVADRADAAGRPVLVGPPPDDPAAALALVRESLGALVRPDLRGVLVLRLDDPGASARRHLRSWTHADVTDEAWSTLWDTLAGFGRVSVFCCPGWVTGDGEVRPSRDVNSAEWAALDEGVARGVADLECHGYTHMVADLDAWIAAPDRFDSPDWYRELWPPRAVVEPGIDEQAAVIEAWQAACGLGTALVAPGDAWGLNTLCAARARGLRLFCSWGICRLDLPTPTWSLGVGSPYLDEPDPSWFAAGLPTVGYWHDRDMAIHGPGWVGKQLDRWRDCGARRAWGFADLARAYATPIDAVLIDGEVVVRSAPDVPLLVEKT